MRFANILFPVDFSERCRAAAPFVKAIAARDHASLTLAHYIEVPVMAYGGGEGCYMPEFEIPRLIEEARHQLTFFGGEYFAGMGPELIAEFGDPGSCLMELARSTGVDLVMMPTRGRGRFRAALLGSVTAKVLHDAECAVWTTAHVDVPDVPISTEWRKVVCAIDTSEDTTEDTIRLIRCAAELQAGGRSIHLVHSIPPPLETRPEKYLDRDFQIFLEDSARNTICRMQRAAQTNFPVSIKPGKISTVIAAAARDLEVISS